MYRFLFFLALIPTLLRADLVPTTSAQLTEYMNEAQHRVLKSVADLVSVPEEEKSVEKILRPWNRLNSDVLMDFRLLYFLKGSDFPTKVDADLAIQAYQGFLYGSIVQNFPLFRSLIDSIKNSADQPVSQYDQHQISAFLDSCEQIKSGLTSEEQKMLMALQSESLAKTHQPFLYFKSSAPEKKDSQALTVMTLNTCFIPGAFPFLFGGVALPWEKRVSLLSEKILEVNPDIVCLQEVFAEDATYALFEALKNGYTHFYGAIGPRVLGFDLKTIGSPSGLFVASKYPIERSQFTLFAAAGLPMNYGVFDFVVKDGQNALAHIYTTHMQPFPYEQFPQIRALQLKQIIEKMQRDRDAESQTIPYFLCGDLNVAFGSKEPALALIEASFHDDYNNNQSVVGEKNQTCTDYITNYMFSKEKEHGQIEPNFQILDYALLLKTSNECHRISTKRISMNDLSKPEEAISDHHALLTSIISLK